MVSLYYVLLLCCQQLLKLSLLTFKMMKVRNVYGAIGYVLVFDFSFIHLPGRKPSPRPIAMFLLVADRSEGELGESTYLGK